MTIMAQKMQLKNNWTNSTKHSPKESIHSGHFMVSDFEAEEQDEDELAVPVPEEDEIKATSLNNSLQNVLLNDSHSDKSVGHQLSIETSLSKLFQCMSLAYRQKLTSPKWNRFKGIRLRWKDKIRLNNVIWRCWHIQFINKKKTLVCQFASPLDVDTHKKPEAVVLEGKYWKRKLNAVTAEYKKWRMYCHNQILGRPQKYQDMCTEIDSQDYWTLTGGDNMMVDEDYMGLMTDTLFSTISAQPFPFPDPREIARNTNLADFIQPSLVQLQPNLDEIMEIEPLQADLLQSSKLSTVPEESGVLQTVPSYQSKLVASTADGIGTGFAQNSYGPTETMWYLPPEFVDVAAPAPPTSLPPPPYPQTRMSASSANPVRQVPMHIPTPPPPPPSPSLSKADVYTPPKNKTKGRTRNSTTKKMAAYTSNNQQQPLIVPMMSTSSPPQQQQQQEQAKQQQQSSTLLAQILTNNSSASYGFLPKEQSQQSVSPSKLVTMSSNCEEQPFIQQLFASIDNQVIYKPDNLHKAAGTYVVNTDNKANPNVTSQRTSSPGITSVLNKSMQPSITNMGNVCTESLATSEQLSLSPLNVGSPTSPPASKDAPPIKEQRRVCHINAEQKRRCNIKNGFDTLHSLIPQLSQNPNAKMSKASMLQKGAEYIRQLRIERSNLKQEIDSLRQEIDVLNTAIFNCQALLPATGAPISRHRSSKMRDMFKQHVKNRTHENWKFWLLSLICEPLLESFNNYVSTNSLDELYHTTLQWVEQHCTLVILRQIVLNSLRQLCTSTEVLTDPARLPNEARAAVDKSGKKHS
uniref:Putative mlx interactor n=1 Tax=Panstrongylus lignarius TaxID=156445 RepID=A0A224XIH4_9HEMI